MSAASESGLNVFPDLRIEDLRAEIEPKRLGRRAGEQGLPTLDATHDPSQTKIEYFIEEKKIDAVGRRDNYLEQVARHLEDLDRSLLPSEIDAAVDKSLDGFRETEQRELKNLKQLRHEFETLRRDFFDFRHKHDLDREPRYASQQWMAFWISLVVVLFVIESVLNGAFLAVGSESPLEAWALALGFSVVNLVLPAMFFGPASRYVSHVRPGLKMVGVLAILGWLVVALVLNLGLAHFREASADLIEDFGAEAYKRFLASPMGLQDAESWLLFALGFFFSGVAFFEGRNKLFGDPYPGYSDMHKQMLVARHEYEDAWQEVTDQLVEVREEGLDEVNRIVHTAKNSPAERRRTLDSSARLLSDFQAHMDLLQRFGKELIEEYREANRQVRFDHGNPRAFTEDWALTPPPPAYANASNDPDGAGSNFGGLVDGTDDAGASGVDITILDQRYDKACRRVREEWKRTWDRFEAEAGTGGASRALDGTPANGES